MEGWIKLYRKFSDWEWFNTSEMVHLFIYLLLNANHEDGKWRGIDIKRGQILTGLNSLNDNTGISIRKLRTCLDRLQNTKEIDKQTTNKYSIITICNYECYQGEKLNSDKHIDKQATSKRQASDKQATTNKNDNNDNNEKNVRNIIPPTLELIISYCQERENKVNATVFFNHYESNGWMVGKSKMKDWQASVRYWETNHINNNISNGINKHDLEWRRKHPNESYGNKAN